MAGLDARQSGRGRMKLLRLVPDGTKFDFVRQRFIAFAVTGLMLLATVVSLSVRGLNLGIDFSGGILIEARAPDAVDVSALRQKLDTLNLGEVELQNFGGAQDVLMRIQRQPGGDAAQAVAVEKVRALLGPTYDYRRTEVVGPRVGNELMRDGILATVLAVVAIGIYVGLRFEWQFGVAALLATFHDVVTTVGLFSVLHLEFNLTAIAALLTLAGYSINDTVVVFDRVRETLRRSKTADMRQVINDSVNQTLSRTLLTSSITLMAILPMVFLGGETLSNFTTAITFGIFVGTYSSIFVAGSFLIYLPPVRALSANRAAVKAGAA